MWMMMRRANVFWNAFGGHDCLAAQLSQSNVIWSALSAFSVSSRYPGYQVEDGEESSSQPYMPPPYYRTRESDPRNHDIKHLGRLYTIPPEQYKELGCDDIGHLPYGLLPKEVFLRGELFNEFSLMVRRPALEIIRYLNAIKKSTSTRCNTRFILWGPLGCGKTMSLAHLHHYCHNDGYVILNFHKFKVWFTQYLEMAPSVWKTGLFDHLKDSQRFLKDFQVRNAGKLDGLKTHQTYLWSERERTESGSDVMDLVRHGVERPIFAADSLGALLKELRLHSDKGSCRVATIVDGINVIFEPKTLIGRKLHNRHKNRGPWTPKKVEESLEPSELSIVKHLKKMLRSDYSNGVTICSVDHTCRMKHSLSDGTTDYATYRWWQQYEKEMKPSAANCPNYPFTLLGQEGWELMDPFVPVEVEKYSTDELDTMIDYYVDNKYISDVSGVDAARDEIHFLTARIPYDFFKFSPMF